MPADASYCYGKAYQLTGAGGTSFEWSPATYLTSPVTDQNPFAKASRNMIYRLMVTDANGCPSLVPDEVSINVVPAVKIFAGNDTIAAINQPIQLKVIETSTIGVTDFSWSPADFLSATNVSNPMAILPYDQRYIVTGITPEGCEGKDDILIKVYKGPEIYVPTGFTPNNDGLNDILSPVCVGIKQLRYFRIFNRWGQLVYSTQNIYHGWDGKINGVLQSSASFVWMAEAIDFKGNIITRKGITTLIR